jgi:hypothetical protein
MVSKEILRQQAGYFNIIDFKYFSDTLNPEWNNIVSELKKVGPALMMIDKLRLIHLSTRSIRCPNRIALT